MGLQERNQYVLYHIHIKHHDKSISPSQNRRSDCSDCDRTSERNTYYFVPELLESGTPSGRASLFIPLHGLEEQVNTDT